MKKALLLLVGCLGLIMGKAQAYDYIPFPSRLTWHGCTTTCFQGCWESSWSAIMDGDTTINNLVYHTCNSFPLLREDSTKKVYWVSSRDSVFHEILLYDFSLGAGDTMFSNQRQFIIAKVDTPVYNGIPRRTLYISYDGGFTIDDRWIEGIGSTVSEIGRFCSANETVSRVFQDGILIYGSPSDTSCSSFQNPVTPSASKLSIFPNPARNELYINVDESLVGGTLNFYNVTGALVQSELVSIPNMQLSLSNLRAGVYIAEVKTIAERIRQRWVKM